MAAALKPSCWPASCCTADIAGCSAAQEGAACPAAGGSQLHNCVRLQAPCFPFVERHVLAGKQRQQGAASMSKAAEPSVSNLPFPCWPSIRCAGSRLSAETAFGKLAAADALMLSLPACCPHISPASLIAHILQVCISSAGAGAAQEPCIAGFAALACLLQAEEKHLRCRLKTALQEQRSRWDLLAQAEQNFTVAESFTLGWLNVLLRHLWPTLIEKEVSDSVTKELRVRPPGHGGLPDVSYDRALCILVHLPAAPSVAHSD